MKLIPKATSFISGGTTIHAEYLLPTATPNGGVIVLAHGSEGMTDNLTGRWAEMIRDYADELSHRGFLTLTPFYFEKTGSQPERIAADFKRHVFNQIVAGRAAWQAVLADAVAHANTLSSVHPTRVGLLGFSLGGHLCLQLRVMASVLVAFFAPATGLSDSGRHLTLHAQLHNGDADGFVTATDVAAIDRMLQAELVIPELKTYPKAGHGFIGNDPDNTKARTESKAQTLAFFTAHL
jgi:dienelactone hydrolase